MRFSAIAELATFHVAVRWCYERKANRNLVSTSPFFIVKDPRVPDALYDEFR